MTLRVFNLAAAQPLRTLGDSALHGSVQIGPAMRMASMHEGRPKRSRSTLANGPSFSSGSHFRRHNGHQRFFATASRRRTRHGEATRSVGHR